jgi:hypothetical protein
VSKKVQTEHIPSESSLQMALVLGQVASFIIATRSYFAVVDYYVVGRQAVLGGYVMAIAASVGLKRYLRSIAPLIRVRQRPVIVLAIGYTLCLAVPFGVQHVPSASLGTGASLLALFGPIAIGHWFHLQIQKAAIGVRSPQDDK